jgi:hypothetical protein
LLTPKLGDHPLSAAVHCLFSIFAAYIHVYRQPENASFRGD